MIDNTSVILAIIIAERLAAQYETEDCKANFAAIEKILEKHINDNEYDEVVQEVRNHIHHLNEMTYLSAFKDAYQLFLQLGRG